MTVSDSITQFVPIPTDPRFINLTSRVFERLTVLGFVGQSPHRLSLWLCRCECGNTKTILGSALTKGHTRSCGCLLMDTMIQHGESTNRKVTAEYSAYCAAKYRCENPTDQNFKRYGARGIEFRFHSFSEFLKCVGRRPSHLHSLDRIDNDGHYEPNNVQWATKSEQGRNQRTTRRIESDGKSLSIIEWSELLGLKHFIIRSRLGRGWCDSCSLLPIGARCPHH